MGLACQTLQTRLNWLVSYEEPPVLAEQDLVGERAPTGLSFRVLRERPFEVHLSVRADSSMPERIGVAQRILDSYSRVNNQAVFTTIGTGDLIEVLPTAVKGADGKMEPFEALLSTKVYIAPGEYNLGAFVSQVLTEVSQKRPVSIVPVFGPNNLFAQTTVTAGADNEPAREVLVRVFGGINGPRYAEHRDPVRLAWYMAYEPDGRTYFFSVHNYPLPVAPPTQGRTSPGKK